MEKNGPVTLKNYQKMTKMALETLSFTKNIGRHPGGVV